MGIGTGYRKAAGNLGRQGVLNKSTFDQITKNNPNFVNQFNKVKGKQGISFSETDFLANPQSFINRGSVQQQALFNNALTGGALMPIEDDEFVVETDLSDMDPMNLLGYLNNKRRM